MEGRLSLLVDLAALLGREVDFDAILRTACERVAEALSAERATVWLVDADLGDLVGRVALSSELPALRLPMGQGIAGWVAAHGETARVADASLDPRFYSATDQKTGYLTRAVLAVPLREEPRAPVRGVIQLLNRRDGGVFDEADERYLEALAAQLARALGMTTLRARDVANPGVTLRGPINRIVGKSPGLTRVYERVGLAARTHASVLLRGETGTGKGLFARAIHANSARQAAPFVVVDCTTLPSDLVESELFGHERGAFTGADRRVPGKVELAHGGTLFLDEIGDLPLESQGKLLRFLQEGVFERVGGRVTLSTDARIVAATHRDLERLVAEGRFRQDLYYRLRVVEITLPPLRERGAAETVELARHFADGFARTYARPTPVFSRELVEWLSRHAFPGNVRELEHVVESAVALSPDGVLGPPDMPRADWTSTAPGDSAASASMGLASSGVSLPLGLTLDEAARRYAEASVSAAHGNKTEAAKRLGISRNTLARTLGRAISQHGAEDDVPSVPTSMARDRGPDGKA
jgi:DNA-binding NtrC family response regulator